MSYNNHYKYLEREPGLERDPPLERGYDVSPGESIEEYLPESERLIECVGDPHPIRTLEELAAQEQEELVPLLRYWSTSSD